MKTVTSIISKCIGCFIEAYRSKPRQGVVRYNVASALLLLISLFPSAIQAQTYLTMRPWQVRLEVPVGFNGTVTNVVPLRIPTNGASYLTNAVDPANTDPVSYTNWVIAPVNVSVSGAPSGVTATLVDLGLVNPIGTINLNLTTSSTTSNTNLIVKQVFDGTQASGVYTLTITASGAGLPDDVFPLPVEVASIWNGAPLATVNGAGSFSDSSKWLGGIPGQLTNVVFTDLGAQTNWWVGAATSTNFLTNVLISSSTVVGSMRFAMTNGAGSPSTNFHNIFLNPGVNLAIAGVGGFSLMRDEGYWNFKPMYITFEGTNAAIIQTNESSSFSILSDAQIMSVVDMSRVDNLYLDINRFYLADYQGFPNYQSLVYSNGYSIGSTTIGTGLAKRLYMTWNLAKTNYIKSVYVDPDNYTNPTNRTYALTLGRNESTGGGSAADVEMVMGNSNVFNIDSICVGGTFCLGADLKFLNTNSYAKFRNSDGVSRMSVFATADAGGGGTNLNWTQLGDNTKCGGSGLGVDFTKGTVDMLVDRLYLSLDRPNVTSNGKGISQTSGFYLYSGVVDANTAILGYQSQGTQTNQSYCYANMFIENGALLRVNGNLTLGYATATIGSVNAEQNGYGKITIGPGLSSTVVSTVIASNILVGGVSKASTGNAITMVGNASLIVSNSIADASSHGALGTLALSGNNDSLTLFIDGANPNVARVYVTNFTASGTGNKLIISGIKNVASYPIDVVLIAGAGAPAVSAAFFDAGVTMPAGSGLNGTLSTSGTNTINIHIINRSPNHLVWRAPAGASSTTNWDYTSKVWADQNNGGLLTNYDNPDYVAFDDAAGYATNINVSGATGFTPTAINMTNSTLYYTFTSDGSQISGGALNKYGTGTVEIDAPTALSAQINQGTLLGFSPGTIGGASIAAGAVMNFYGNMSGGLTCAGTATSRGTISGTVTVLAGGVVTNATTGTVNNPISVQSGGLLYNAGSLVHVGLGSSGSPQVASGGTFINANTGTIDGSWSGDVLYVNGAFKDMGGSATLYSVTIGSTGSFVVGGDGTGTTTINSDGSGGTSGFPGAALMVQGGTVFLKANGATLAKSMLTCENLSFGGSASQQTQNGCTLVITNVSATPFSAGQSFHFFNNADQNGYVPFNTGASTNTFPVIVPQHPAPGLAWDLSQLWTSGNIGVIVQPQVTLTNSFTIQGSNMIVQFSWDAAYIGWRLESQNNSLSVGLSTNWTGIAGAYTTNFPNASTLMTNSWTLTNKVSDNTGSVIYYRLVYP